ncbi:hypothetical protein [Lentzea aerocolonigenes]|uniref:hypothetical protein n=1 Tax=Lentzea aerocolonigenes TaxID=68170 RepID=UPI0012DD3A3E|nr:hypothetical protein [Lentzea aerocolonigenes]MCP2247188.1 hypothetical protein [Lentzea aerocolonigenes]
MIEGLVPPCTPASPLSSAVNAKAWQLARWTPRTPREVNRQIGVRTRRWATEEQLRAASRYVRERQDEVVSGVDGSLGDGAHRPAVRAAAHERQPL